MEIKPEEYAKNNFLHKRDAKDIINEIVEEGIQEKIKLILDVGCGNGDVTRILSQAFPSAKILAFDILPSMVTYSKAQLSPSEKEKIDFVVQDYCADFQNWNKQIRSMEGKVDLIWSTYALHYAPLHKRQEIIRTLWRLLKPGGRICFNVILARNFLSCLPSKFDKYKDTVRIPATEKQAQMWQSYFETLESPGSSKSVNVKVMTKEWRGLKEDEHFKHYRDQRTFINFFRPFIKEDLPELEKDDILSNCTEFAFGPTLIDTEDGHRIHAYDCAQIRGIKPGAHGA